MCNCKKNINQSVSKVNVTKGTAPTNTQNEYKITEVNGKTFISKR